MIRLFLFFTVLTLTACGGDKKPASSKKDSTTATPSQSSVQNPQNEIPFEGLPNEIAQDMVQNVEYLDYIFHNLPFSMSQDEKASIQANIAYIGAYPQQYIPSGCEPMGRIFYQIKGEIKYEADLYYSQGCQFYLFYVNGEPAYANQMSTAGKNFFDKIIAQAMGAAQSVNGK